MKKSLLFLAILLPALGLAQSQGCPQKLVVSQPLGSSSSNIFSNCFQSFQLSGSGYITAVEIFLTNTYTGNITLTLATGQMQGGTVLYSQVYAFTNATGIITFTVPYGSAPITGTDHHFELNGPGASAAWSSANPYAGGWSTINAFPGAFGPEDMVFNVYTTRNIYPVADIINTSPLTSCSNDADTLQGTLVANAAYQWYLGSQAVSASGASCAALQSGSYYYVVTDTGGCFSTSDTVAVTYVNAPTVAPALITLPGMCIGGNNTLWVTATGDPTLAYQWQLDAGSGYANVTNSSVFSGATNDTLLITNASGTEFGNYRCLVSNTCPNDTSASVNLAVFSPSAPAICSATVDSLSQNNVIYWDKTLTPAADTFYIYRDTANYNYAVVGKVPYSALSEYTDTARSVCVVVNGDPQVTYYKYKLAYKDTCGNMSPMSPYHQTVFMYHTGSLFQWNHYEIEGQTIPVPGLTQYRLMRDNFGTGTYTLAAGASASSTLISDPQYANYVTTADWRIETQWNIVCTPVQRQGNNEVMGTIVKSKSNITNNKTTGVKGEAVQFAVYPNPSSGVFRVSSGSFKGAASITVTSLLGEVVYAAIITSGRHEIDLSGHPAGAYLVHITADRFHAIKKLVRN
jgi:hypothetical protein